MRRGPVLPALVAALAVAACDSSTTGPDTGPSAAEAEAVASQIAGLGAGVMDGLASGLLAIPFVAHGTGPGSSTTEFTRTVACPQGGQTTIEGTARISLDREARTLSAQLDATETAQECAFDARDARVVLNGNPNVRRSAVHRVEAGRLVEARTTQQGSVVYRRGDATRTCDIDLTSTIDPEARTVTVRGSMCGNPIDRTHELPARPRG